MSAAAEGGVTTLTVQADTTEVTAALDSLTEFLQLTLELREGLLHLLNTPGDIARVQLHGQPAPLAQPLRAAFEPTERLRGLVTAVRAGNVHLRAVKETLSHATAYPAEETR